MMKRICLRKRKRRRRRKLVASTYRREKHISLFVEIKRGKSAGVVERGRERVSERVRARVRAKGARWGGGKGM